MYQPKNYLLTMQSHWMIHQPTYKAVEDSLPIITEYGVNQGVGRMPKTPIHKAVKKHFPDVYSVPLFRRQFCKMLVDEIDELTKHIAFETNDYEDELRQIPEIVLKDHLPDLYRNMWFAVRTILSPIFLALWQRPCPDIATIQIANYNVTEKQEGAWHHDESSDISVVVPLNTGGYEGGGTEFHNHGVLGPLPNGHALVFPSFTNLHRGLPVESGDRYLLVFWLYERSRVVHLNEYGD